MEIHQVIKIILIAIFLNFSKTADCTFFGFLQKFGSQEKNKSLIVFSFDLNLKDNPKQLPHHSHNLKKAKRRTNRQREKRRGKRKTRPKVKPSQKSKTE